MIPAVNPTGNVFLYRRSNGAQGIIYYDQQMTYAQDVSSPEKYLRSRLVSGIIKILSNTRPGGNFDIAGKLLGMTVQSLPPGLDIMDNETLLQYGRLPSSTRQDVDILDGIVWR